MPQGYGGNKKGCQNVDLESNCSPNTQVMLGTLVVRLAEAYMVYRVNAKTPPSDAPLTLRDIVAQNGWRT